MIVHPFLRPVLSKLPFPPFDGIPYSYLGWTDTDKGRIHHEKLGRAFVLVSSHRLVIFCADADTCLELTSKYRVWTKSKDLYAVFATFGSNLNTANGSDWQRHRRITGPAFREETYDLVWNESRNQARQMFDAVMQHGQPNLEHLRDNFALLAMHVLSSAVFGHSYSYGHGLTHVEPGHKLSYFASLSFILKEAMSVILFKSLDVPDWLLPSFLKRLKLAVSEYQLYLSEAVESEHKAGGIQREGASLVSALIQANESAKKEDRKTGTTAGAKVLSLSDEELYGNMYIFNLAGFETTSFALSFSVPYLAIHPELQSWIQEEIDDAFKSARQGEVSYESTFHRLPRCREILLETMRHHAAVSMLPRMSPETEETRLHFPTLGRDIVIPRNTYVAINLAALHFDPKRWGSDVYTFNPRRWITTTPPADVPGVSSQTMSSPASNAFGEYLTPEPQPSKSTSNAPLYIPWLSGPRVCPGKKFSHVEYVAVIATVFREWGVVPARVGSTEGGEQAAVEALRNSMKNAYFNLTPRLWKPESAGVRWVKREEMQ